MSFSLIKYLIAAVVIALVLAIYPGNAQASPLDIEDCIKALPAGYTEPLFSGLGNHKYPTLTEELKSKKAKDYFNQGMTLLYAFNHPEAIHSFNQAANNQVAKSAPEAAMPYWGIAMAASPDINTGATDACLNLAYKAVELAQKNAKTELEKEIAKALAQRYKHTSKEPVHALASKVPVKLSSNVNNKSPSLNANFQSARAVCVDAEGKKVYVDPEGKYVCVDAIAYADAMEDLYKYRTQDDDVATLYAAALMNISPWQWWRDNTPSPEIQKAIKVLSQVLKYEPNNNESLNKLLNYDAKNSQVLERKPEKCEVLEHKSTHIGANHYFIHATEESPCPEVALPSANRIAELAPAAGHLQHMPSHVYERIGKYAKATEANYKAVYVDRAYIYQTPETARYPLHYLSHNLHFLTDSLSIQGRESEALAAAQELFENTKKYSVDDYNPLHNQTLVQVKDDYFFTVPIWTAVRFNAWNFLSSVGFEEVLFRCFTKRNLPFTKAMWQYGQVLKYLSKPNPVTAPGDLAKLDQFWRAVGKAPTTLEYGNNDASKLFRIANLVLVARTLEALPSDVSKDFIDEVKSRVEKYSALKPDSDLFEGDIKREQRIIEIWERAVCVENGKKAVCLENGLDNNVCREKGLNYNEPPDWYYPLRESLGAAYYRQENFGEAERVFCEDLQIHNCDYENQKIHKMNGRSLFGLIKSIEAQPDKEVPQGLKSEFEKAWKNATVEPSLKTM